MTTVYVLTDAEYWTYERVGLIGKRQWGEGVEHAVAGGGEIHDPVWLKAYPTPALAALMRPILWGDILHWDRSGPIADPVLWEADGDVGTDIDMLRFCTRIKTLRRVVLPWLSCVQFIQVGILSALAVLPDEPWAGAWRERAEGWLSGEDRRTTWPATGRWASAEVQAARDVADSAVLSRTLADSAYLAARAARQAAMQAPAYDISTITEGVLAAEEAYSAPVWPVHAAPALSYGSLFLS